MKQKFQKILTISILLVLVFSTIPSKVFALADVGIRADSTDIKVNQSVTVSVSVSSAETWNLSVAASGGSLSGELKNARSVTGGTSDTVINASFSANTPGQYKITVSGTISSHEDVNNKVINPVTKSITINVSADEGQNETGGNTNPDPGTTTDPEGNTNPDPGATTDPDGNTNTDPGTTTEPGGNTNENSGPTIDSNENNNENPETPFNPEQPSNGGDSVPQEGGNGNSNEGEQQQEKSTNNYLKALTVDQGTLTPAFSREREEYTIEFPEDFDYSTLETINVWAQAEHEKAKIEGTGNITVKDGENVIEINVMPETVNPVRTYRITFIKPEKIEQSDLRLKDLTVNAINEDGESKELELNPVFDPETFNYKLDVDSDIEKLEVNGEVENEKVLVTITGGENLHSGKNLVKITLQSPEDENIKSVYQIAVNKERAILASTEPVEGLNESSRKKIIIGIVVGVIVILGVTLAVLVIINNRKNKKEKAGSEDDEDYDKYTKKKSPDELEEKKQILFNYDDEDTYLTDENLARLSNEFRETAKRIDLEEKEENDNIDKMAGLIGSEEYSNDFDEDEYEKDDEVRANKLAELEKELKADRKTKVKKNSKKKEDSIEEKLAKIEKEAEKKKKEVNIDGAKENSINDNPEEQENIKNDNSKETKEKNTEIDDFQFNKDDFLNDIKSKKGKHSN